MTYTTDSDRKLGALKQRGEKSRFCNIINQEKKDDIEALEKKLIAAKKKVEDLKKQRFPDQYEINHAQYIVEKLEKTLISQQQGGR